MKVGIIRYPGSNCDLDTFRFFDNAFYIWHKETKCPKMDLLIIPGGFAFGDRIYKKATENYTLSPGEQAIKSPVTNVILEAHKRQIPIVGICNGFQILIKLNLLPGLLLQNKQQKFDSQTIKCTFSNKHYNITQKTLDIPIANQFGRYTVDDQIYQDMLSNNQILLQYIDYDNGSFNKIGGVCNN